jgi:hypothetical protein
MLPWKGKSFVVKMVDTGEVNEEDKPIDVDLVLKKTAQTGALLIGAYFIGSTVRHILIGHPEAAQIAPVFNNTIAPVISNTVNNGGYMRKIVRCVETDELWPSISKAAEQAGASLSMMSKHVNGHTADDINGLHYVIEGLAAG